MRAFSVTFIFKTYLLQAAAALLLAVSLGFYFVSQNTLQHTEQNLHQLESDESKLNHLKRNLNNYQALLASSPWPVDAELNQEPLNVSVSLDQWQLKQLDTIIKSNYEHDSLFFLESFKLKEMRVENSAANELQMQLLGEKRIILY